MLNILNRNGDDDIICCRYCWAAAESTQCHYSWPFSFYEPNIYVVNRITAFGFFPGTCGEFHRIRGEYLSPVAAVERSAPKRAGAQARSGYDGIASCKYDETVVTVSNGLYNIIQNLYKYDHNLVSRMILANQNKSIWWPSMLSQMDNHN